jgi:hypothetical protein
MSTIPARRPALVLEDRYRNRAGDVLAEYFSTGMEPANARMTNSPLPLIVRNSTNQMTARRKPKLEPLLVRRQGSRRSHQLELLRRHRYLEHQRAERACITVELDVPATSTMHTTLPDRSRDPQTAPADSPQPRARRRGGPTEIPPRLASAQGGRPGARHRARAPTPSPRAKFLTSDLEDAIGGGSVGHEPWTSSPAQAEDAYKCI